MMLTRVPSEVIPPSRLPLVECCYCWYVLHPGEDFPSAWSSTICDDHADWQLTRLAARRRASVKTVNFVLVESEPQPEPLFFAFVPHQNRKPYPRNWSRVSWLVRRLYGFRCAWCGSSHHTRCHHLGTAYADGRPGNSHDKHDLRWPENLICLCQECERMAEEWDV